MTTLVIQAAVEDILLALDQTRLAEYGEHVQLTNNLGQIFVVYNEFTKERGLPSRKLQWKTLK